MNDTLTRIRKVFLESGKNQTEIGKKIGKTSQYVWKILNDDNISPSESVLKDICREFNISYSWLTQGTEPVDAQIEHSSMARIDSIMTGENETAKSIFRAFSKLDEKEWELLKKIITEVSKEI